jgi:hypothetical protein
VLALLAFALVACAGAAPAAARVEGPRLVFQEPVHDFGELRYGERREHRFAFTNTGSRPLEIAEVRREPARPGGCT